MRKPKQWVPLFCVPLSSCKWEMSPQCIIIWCPGRLLRGRMLAQLPRLHQPLSTGRLLIVSFAISWLFSCGPDSVTFKHASFFFFFLQIYSTGVYGAVASVAWQFWADQRTCYDCVDKKGSCICLVCVLPGLIRRQKHTKHDSLLFLSSSHFSKLSPASRSPLFVSPWDEYIKCREWVGIIAG